jgi:hypothetical protein
MNCDRCHQDSRVTTMSMFNLDTLCMECKEEEEKHPKYQEAREAERQACLRGDMNYPGIGKPQDL